MKRFDKIKILLSTLEQKKSIAIRFANRYRNFDDEFVELAMEECRRRIQRRGGRTYDPLKGSPGSYVGRILYRVCVHLLDQHCKRPRLSMDIEVGTNDFDPVATAIRREQIADAHSALASLSRKDRAAINRWAKRKEMPIKKRTKQNNSSRDVQDFRVRMKFLHALTVIHNRRLAPPN